MDISLDDFVDVKSLDDEFRFSCSDGCGECCLNRDGDEITVSPYDLYVIRKHFANNDKFNEEKHFEFHMGKNSSLPVCTLKNKEVYGGDVICTFLKKKDEKYKCSIHESKPSICRMFPVGRVTDRDGNISYKVFKEVLCNENIPYEERDKHTLREWCPNIEDSDRAAKMFFAFRGKYKKLIQKKKFDDVDRNILFTLLHTILYTDKYDFNNDFHIQFETHLNKALEAVEMYFDNRDELMKQIKNK